jgi:glycosyltransferase involved in cell wall biosynthesis
VAPVFNDWASLARLLAELDKSLQFHGAVLDVIAVNDASTTSAQAELPKGLEAVTIQSVTILDLKTNVGHQFAIALGLQHAAENATFDAVIVMDADGQDRPSDVVRLLEIWRANPESLVVACRARRSESIAFRMCYMLYRFVFRILIGRAIQFNFLMVPTALLPAVLNRPELVNHLAATLLRTQLPMVSVLTWRGRRYTGSSQMNMPALVLHGVGALSVFSDILFSRLLIASLSFGLLCALGMIVVALLRILTDLAIPGWATNAMSALAILVAQMVILMLCTGFLLLSSRSAMLLTTLEGSKLIAGRRSVVITRPGA